MVGCGPGGPRLGLPRGRRPRVDPAHGGDCPGDRRLLRAGRPRAAGTFGSGSCSPGRPGARLSRRPDGVAALGSGAPARGRRRISNAWPSRSSPARRKEGPASGVPSRNRSCAPMGPCSAPITESIRGFVDELKPDAESPRSHPAVGARSEVARIESARRRLRRPSGAYRALSVRLRERRHLPRRARIGPNGIVRREAGRRNRHHRCRRGPGGRSARALETVPACRRRRLRGSRRRRGLVARGGPDRHGAAGVILRLP